MRISEPAGIGAFATSHMRLNSYMTKHRPDNRATSATNTVVRQAPVEKKMPKAAPNRGTTTSDAHRVATAPNRGTATPDRGTTTPDAPVTGYATIRQRLMAQQQEQLDALLAKRRDTVRQYKNAEMMQHEGEYMVVPLEDDGIVVTDPYMLHDPNGASSCIKHERVVERDDGGDDVALAQQLHSRIKHDNEPTDAPIVLQARDAPIVLHARDIPYTPIVAQARQFPARVI